MASADSIVRLKLESGEYEAKIKRATQGLLAMESECRKVGGTLAVLDKEQKDYVEALGRMETVSKTAKGRLAELTSAFTNLSSQYKRLTDEEKKGDFGKALQKSLSELKTRIGDAKNELNGIQSELNDNGNILDKLAGKFGITGAEAVKLGASLAALQGALKIAKDAFFASETNVDEWGRVVESAGSLYDGFLHSLNTGDISGFISRMDDIVAAARKAYDAMDELGTFNAFNQINMKKARNGLADAIYDFREGNGSKDNVKAAAEALKKELQTRGRMEKDAYKARVEELAKEAGVNSKDLMSVLSGSYGTFDELKKVQNTGKRYSYVGGGMFGTGQTITESYAANDRERLAEMLRKLNDSGHGKSLEALQALGGQSLDTAYEAQQIDKQVQRVLRGGGSGGKGGGSGSSASIGGFSAKDIAGLSVGPTESLKELNAQLSMYKNLMQEAKSVADMMEAQSGIERVQKEIKAQPIALSLGVSVDEIVPIQEKIDNYFKENPIKILPIEATAGSGAVTTAKNVEKSWAAASRAIGAAGSALQQVEDPGAKIAGIVGQAIANIALGFATASASPATGAAGVFGWIAASTAGLATMLATITSIKNATEYHAEGGFVGGLAKGTDTIPAMLTPGELVLNAAQQGNVASVMSAQGQQMDIRHSVRAEDIVIAINNYGRRTGRGEILKG